MGVVNVTPDSFSDGGEWFDARRGGRARARAGRRGRGDPRRRRRVHAARRRSRSPRTRSCAASIPVVEALARDGRAASRSTRRKLAVAARRARRRRDATSTTSPRCAPRPRWPALVADRGADCCLMHMRGEPRTMQDDPRYDDVVDDVKAFLERARRRSRSREGIAEAAHPRRPRHRLRQDAGAQPRAAAPPGRDRRAGLPASSSAPRASRSSAAHRTRRTRTSACPGRSPTNVLALERGARVFRVHDVAAARQALAVAAATLRARWRLTSDDDDDDDLDDDFDDDVDEDDGDQTEVTIEVRGLSLYTHHGVTAAEREIGQRLVLDIRLEVGDVRRDRHRPRRGHRRLRRGLQHRLARRPAALLQDARAAVLGDRRPPAGRLLAPTRCGSRPPSPSRRSRCPCRRSASRSGASAASDDD